MGVFDAAVFDSGVFDTGDAGGGGPGSFYWGPMFSEHSGGHYWWPHFPEGAADVSLVVPAGTGAAATFALDLQSGATLVMTWDTDVFKAYDGSEQRRSKLELPHRKISGQAFLRGTDGRATRARLQRFAYIGATFLLSMPWEEMTIADDSDTTLLEVGDTSLIDWGLIGQRAIVIREDDDGETSLSADVVIQNVGPNSLTIDATHTTITKHGARVQPTVAVLLDPTQSFGRYATDPDKNIERWAITAETIPFGYEQEAQAGRASLADGDALSGAAIVSDVVGSSSNGVQLTLTLTGSESLIVIGGHYTYTYSSTTEVQSFIEAVAGIFTVIGTYNLTDLLTLDDQQTVTLAGGNDKSWGTMGLGTELAMFSNRPVWDRGITVADVNAESLFSLSTIINLGGRSIGVGQANTADWGRSVTINDQLGEPFQWLKLFLLTACGMCKTWYLPTWRADLDTVASSDPGVYTLKVAGPSFETGDFFGWWPKFRDSLHVEMDDGTAINMFIKSAVDNHDGTITIVGTEHAPVSLTQTNASATFTAAGLEITATRTTVGDAGNFGSITFVADGTGGTPAGGGGYSVEDDGVGNITFHFQPGCTTDEDVGFGIVLTYLYQFNLTHLPFTNSPMSSGDAQGPIPFAGGAESGELDYGDIITLPDGDITLVSWLELCRFDSDEFTVTFNGPNFSFTQPARAVQQ